MKLTAFQINGQPVGSVVTSWTSTDLNGNVPFKREATVSPGYTDISSITNWDRFGYSLSDYKVVRNEIIILAANQGFINLSQGEKIIASKMFAVIKAYRDTVHTIEEQIQHGMSFHIKSTEARSIRRNKAKVEAYNRLQNGAERADLMGGVGTLLEMYVNYGIEGIGSGDIIPGLFDYLESRVGSAYENTGLLSKTYTVEGMTIPEFSAKLMDILKNGNY